MADRAMVSSPRRPCRTSDNDKLAYTRNTSDSPNLLVCQLPQYPEGHFHPPAPFDSPEYLFEVKWDGVQALAACGPDAAVWGRDRADYSARYPELAVLGRLSVLRLTLGGRQLLQQLGVGHIRGQ